MNSSLYMHLPTVVPGRLLPCIDSLFLVVSIPLWSAVVRGWSAVRAGLCCAGHHPTLHQHFIKSKKVLDHHQVSSIFQYCNIPAAGIKTFFNYLSLYLLYTMHLMYSIDPKTGKRLYTLKKVAPDGTASTSAHPGTSITLFVFYVNFFLFFF